MRKKNDALKTLPFGLTRTSTKSAPIRFLFSAVSTKGNSGHGPSACLAAFRVLLLMATGFCQAQTPPATRRPILFVHGFCSQATDWSTSSKPIINGVRAQPNVGGLYQNYVQSVYYNGLSVKLWPGGQDFASLTPAWTRFFSIEFFNPYGGGGSNSGEVAQVSIL